MGAELDLSKSDFLCHVVEPIAERAYSEAQKEFDERSNEKLFIDHFFDDAISEAIGSFLNDNPLARLSAIEVFGKTEKAFMAFAYESLYDEVFNQVEMLDEE